MKSAFKKVASVVMAAVLTVGAAVSLTSCGKTNYAKNNTTFKIGMSGPLSGDYAVYGEAVKKGAELAIAEINKAGGIGGVQLELMSYDDQADPTLVRTGFYQQYEAGMQVSLGCVTSGACAEFAELSADEGVFFIAPSASNDEIPKEYNAYQLCFADANQGAAAASYVNDNYAGQTIGLLYCAGDNYSEGIKNTFKSKVSKNVTVVETSFNEGATDFSSQAETLKNCGFIFMPIYYTPAYQFMQAMQSKADNTVQVFYGCDGFDGITGLQGYNADSIPQKISYLSHFNANATEGAAKTFIDAYTVKFGEAPIQFAAGAYDCVYAIVNAIKTKIAEFSVTMSAEDACDLLTSVFDGGSFSYSGATGSNMTWNKAANNGYGFVDKTAGEFVVKENTAQKR